MSVSVDGFIAGYDGSIDWAAPDEDLMAFHIQQTREVAADLCGRRLYEDMLPWETDPRRAESEFARLWKAIPKVVFSSTLTRGGNATWASGDAAQELSRLEDGPAATIFGRRCPFRRNVRRAGSHR